MAVPNPEPGDLGDREDRDAASEPERRPELPDADIEARWADLVEQLGDLERPGTSPEPSDAGPERPDEPTAHIVVPAPGPRDWPATPEVEALEESETHFTPPDPGPVLSRTPLLTLAWIVVVAVPVLTVVSVIVRALVPALSVPGWVGPAAGAAFLGGIGVLVWRMPHRRDPDDPGNGAVV